MTGFSHSHGNGVKDIRALAWEEPQMKGNTSKMMVDQMQIGDLAAAMLTTEAFSYSRFNNFDL
jgi:hypothetical protein